LVLPAKTGLRRFFTKKVAAAVSVGAVLLLAPAAVHLARPGAHGAALDLSTELQAIPNVVPKMEDCADSVNNCFGNKCCKTSGEACWNTGDKTGKCSETCPPGTPCWVEKAYYAFQPEVLAVSNSMYCYTVWSAEPGNDTKSKKEAADEVAILKTQLRNGVGLFTCNDWTVFSDTDLELSPGPPVKLVATTVTPRAEYKSFFRKDKPNMYVNTPLFMAVWQEMFQTQRYGSFSWVIKVDAPTVFLPATLRTKLPTSVPEKGIYIENCKGVLEGYFGNLEIASTAAFKRFGQQLETKYGIEGKDSDISCWRQLGETCKKNWKYGTWGEDRFLQDVMDSAQVEKKQDFTIANSGTCPGSRPADQKNNADFVPECKPGEATAAAVHPFRTPEAWFKCLGTITGVSYAS